MGEVIHGKFGTRRFRAKYAIRQAVDRVAETVAPTLDYKAEDFQEYNRGTYPKALERFALGHVAASGANGQILISDTHRQELWEEVTRGTNETLEVLDEENQ